MKWGSCHYFKKAKKLEDFDLWVNGNIGKISSTQTGMATIGLHLGKPSLNWWQLSIMFGIGHLTFSCLKRMYE